jgi:hypothetical protein
MSGRPGRKRTPTTPTTTAKDPKKKSTGPPPPPPPHIPRRDATIELTEDDTNANVTTARKPNKDTGRKQRPNPGRKLPHETEAQMVAFAQRTINLGIQGLRQEFTQLRGFMPVGTRVAFDQNVHKNRYTDVTCIDQTRVVLQYGQSPIAGDYIHANLVNSLMPQNKFICAQGPLASTVVDWWRMVWQEKAKHILMLCRTEEDGKSKCHKYWPEPDYCSCTNQYVLNKPSRIPLPSASF